MEARMPTINIDMDQSCTQCGEQGPMPSGLCMMCAARQAVKTSSERSYKKIKVDPSTGYLELTYTELSTIGNSQWTREHVSKFNREVHADLRQALQNFIPHLLVITETKEALVFLSESMDPFDPADVPGCEKYTVTGISVGGDDEYQGVTIVGRKKLATKKVLNLVAPFTMFDAPDGQEPYVLSLQLLVAYDTLIREVNLFLDHGKCAPDPQMEMEFEEEAA